MMEFKMRLKYLRTIRGVTQKELAEHLSYQASSVSNYENAGNLPSIPDLIKIGEYLDVSIDYLLGITDYDTNIYSKELENEECIKLFVSLSEEEKCIILGLMKYFDEK